jgi:cytochrome c-type biogenesis protein CcmE
MKKTQIVLLVLIAAAICVIVSMFGDFSTYETFASASANPGKSYYVIGYLEKDKPTDTTDINRFTFFAKDKAGTVAKVIFNGGKPVDIERSEQIVMRGYIEGETFRCIGIQMKCPSKYKKDQVVGEMG